MCVSSEIMETAKNIIEEISDRSHNEKHADKYKIFWALDEFYKKGIIDGQQSVMNHPVNFMKDEEKEKNWMEHYFPILRKIKFW